METDLTDALTKLGDVIQLLDGNITVTTKAGNVAEITTNYRGNVEAVRNRS